MRIWVLITTCLLIGCNAEVTRDSAPPNLIPEEKMILVMKDMVKLESLISQKYKNVTKYYNIMIKSGDSLLKTHNVTRQQYESSIGYYGTHQEQMMRMNAEVNDQLTKEKAQLRSKQ